MLGMKRIRELAAGFKFGIWIPIGHLPTGCGKKMQSRHTTAHFVTDQK
jgi:hypothetical protein